MLSQRWTDDDVRYEPDYAVRGVRLARLGGEPYEGGAWVIVDAGTTMTSHVNPTGESEIFFVFEGTGVLHVGSEHERVMPGDSVLVPPGVRHELHNDGEGQLRVLALWWGAIDDDHE